MCEYHRAARPGPRPPSQHGLQETTEGRAAQPQPTSRAIGRDLRGAGHGEAAGGAGHGGADGGAGHGGADGAAGWHTFRS
jgi:hypothetical protein